MRRYLTLVLMLFLVIPAGISFSGCTRNPAGNFCNGLGYGTKDTDVIRIDLEPKTTGLQRDGKCVAAKRMPSLLGCLRALK